MQLPEPLRPYFYILSRQRFTRSELQVEWNEKQPQLSAARLEQEEHFWQSYLQQHPEADLFNGTLCQLLEYDFSRPPFHLVFAPIQFKSHFFSVMKGRHLRIQGAPPRLGVGVSAVVISADESIFFVKRSERVAANPGQFDVFGGHIDPESHESVHPGGNLAPDPFVAIEQELQEELNLNRTQIRSLEGVGLLSNLLTGQPELVFRCFTSADAATINSIARQAIDRKEYSHLIQLPNEAEKLSLLCRKYAKDFTPSGLGSLWVHYLLEDEPLTGE